MSNQEDFLDNNNDFEFIDGPEESQDPLNIDKEYYDMACQGGKEEKYDDSIHLFQQLYNPSSPYTLRKGLCTIADYLYKQNKLQESIDGYKHALYINQPENPEEDLQYYIPDFIEQKINLIKKQASFKDYKIAVYAICKDEINNLQEWFQSMGEADYICVLDTGSTDGSYELLQKYHQNNPEKVLISQKIYNPWRFDTPRNDSLKLVPKEADICICTDPDERLVPGWADMVRFNGKDEYERMYYLYAWSHLENGEPARVFGYDKIHKNNGLGSGKFPVHEALYSSQYGHAHLQPNQYTFLDSNYIMLHHYPKQKDSRVSYLPLLQIRYKENPNDFYSLIYLAHEYRYQQQGQNCIDFINNNTLPYYREHQVEPIYFSNIYMFLGDCYLSLKEYTTAEECYNKGIELDPYYRDNYLKLASLYIFLKKEQEAIEVINNGFLKSRRYVSGLEEDVVGSFKPGELLAIAYYNLQKKDVAQQYITIAYNMDSENKELQEHYERMFA